MRILYLDLDTLRPDHLGCYGYPRDTSPHIDRIALPGYLEKLGAMSAAGELCRRHPNEY